MLLSIKDLLLHIYSDNNQLYFADEVCCLTSVNAVGACAGNYLVKSWCKATVVTDVTFEKQSSLRHRKRDLPV